MKQAWLNRLLGHLDRGESCVVITLADRRGSVPQQPGAKVIVTASSLWGTIGGGNLEYKAIQRACRFLHPSSAPRHIDKLTLGAGLGQCCGGVVTLVYQRFSPPDSEILRNLTEQADYLLTPLSGPLENRLGLTDGQLDDWRRAHLVAAAGYHASASTHLQAIRGEQWLVESLRDTTTPLLLFGAGHVGRAVVQALAPLPFRITWVDSREQMFPASTPTGVHIARLNNPSLAVRHAPEQSWHLVMTHDHGQDFDIIAAILARDSFAHLGLIGSATKLQRFRHRLVSLGFSDEIIGRINCPIGIAGIRSKEPAAIAASVAAQLLQLREMDYADTQTDKSLAHNAPGYPTCHSTDEFREWIHTAEQS